jgi:hypothetical protein
MIDSREFWFVGVESYSLTSSAKQHELPTPELFDSEDGDEGSKEVFCAIQCSQKTARETGQTDAVLKDSGGIVL